MEPGVVRIDPAPLDLVAVVIELSGDNNLLLQHRLVAVETIHVMFSDSFVSADFFGFDPRPVALHHFSLPLLLLNAPTTDLDLAQSSLLGVHRNGGGFAVALNDLLLLHRVQPVHLGGALNTRLGVVLLLVLADADVALNG